MADVTFTSLNRDISKDNTEWQEYDFVFPNEISIYAAELIQKHNLPEVVAELIGLINLEMSEDTMTITSEDAYKIKEILQSNNIEEIKSSELAWKTLCVILYDKAKQLIENAIQFKAFADFSEELEKASYINLEFVPEDSRELPICNDVLWAFKAVKNIRDFFAKSRMLQMDFVYLSGGIVLCEFSDEYVLKDLKDNRVLFQCPHIEHMKNTRLFKFSHDEQIWGLVDDTGRIVAPEEYWSLCFWSSKSW